MIISKNLMLTISKSFGNEILIIFTIFSKTNLSSILRDSNLKRKMAPLTTWHCLTAVGVKIRIMRFQICCALCAVGSTPIDQWSISDYCHLSKSNSWSSVILNSNKYSTYSPNLKRITSKIKQWYQYHCLQCY